MLFLEPQAALAATKITGRGGVSSAETFALLEGSQVVS